MKVAFVCVQNAGRSQMAAAFAERERRDRGLADDVEVLTGGTRPASAIHDVVRVAMAEVGLALGDRTPREITPADLQDADIVITMGCAAEDVCPATWTGENRDWGLPDPHGKSLAAVRDIRAEIRDRVGALFDDLEAGREGPGGP